MRSLASLLNHSRLRAAAGWEQFPYPFQLAMARYVIEGSVLPPYLRAVAAGDLQTALAVSHYKPIGVDIYKAVELFDRMPPMCHGTLARVVEWEMVGGCDGIHRTNEMIGRVYP